MRALSTLLVFVGGLLSLGAQCTTGGFQSPHEPQGRALFTSPQSNPIALSPDGTWLYVANTTSNSISVIDTVTQTVIENRLRVGIDPVSVAVRPDGLEVWVANHVSDSISVVDTDPASPTYLQVIQTIQALTGLSGATAFDEPVGIAFVEDNGACVAAGNPETCCTGPAEGACTDKAYVALSSTNDIKIIDTDTYSTGISRHITAQEPRAIAVRGGKLYVAAFESNNQTEVSACPFGPVGGTGPEQCTLGPAEIIQFITDPNIPGADKNIVIDPDVPDRDLFVYDTSTDTLTSIVSGVGTLLYGLAVDSTGEVFITQTDARNHQNGIEGDNLIDLDNRIFLNRIARIDCSGGSCGSPGQIELEPRPEPECGASCGSNPAPGQELGTPYGIAISGDDSTIVATAAATSRVFTVDTTTGNVLDIVDVGNVLGKAIPRGIALKSDGTGAPLTAYVLNTLDNTVSVVDVQDPNDISVAVTFAVGDDPTPDEIRRGRIEFNNAFASDTGTFSCASCHPDGNVDQLLWRIGGACFFGDCTEDDEPRSTMPVRGLKNTLPLHWDGSLGDPFGGTNGAEGPGGSGGTDCDLGGPEGDHDCFVDLAEESLAGVMCDQTGTCNPGGNQLTSGEIDDMAHFLASVSYPPARERRIDDVVSSSAVDGFADFFGDQGGNTGNPASCADMDSGCHSLPLTTDTNSSTLAGFDVPTMRGLNDRFLQFSLGITSAHEVQVTTATWDPVNGPEELTTFATAFAQAFTPVYNVGPTDIFQMVDEASTGTSGATGRQVTLSQATINGITLGILTALEDADNRGVINLKGNGLRNGTSLTVSYRALPDDDYQVGPDVLTRAQLEAEVTSGDLLVTLTGHLPQNHGSSAEPLLRPNGTPDEPIVSVPGSNNVSLTGIDVDNSAVVFLDGAVNTNGGVSCSGPATSQSCTVSLNPGPSNGLHLLQVQNPSGPLSNEMPICKGNFNSCL